MIATSISQHRKKVGLIIMGTLLTVGWMSVVVGGGVLSLYPVNYFSDSETRSQHLIQILQVAPLMAGTVLISLGVIYDSKLRRMIKFLIVLVMAGLLFYITAYATTLITILLELYVGCSHGC